MDIFYALSDQNRRRILELLSERGSLTATDISKKFSISAPAISQHLKILREADLLIMEKKAQQRIYRLNTKSMRQLEEWAQKLASKWNDRFEKLDKLLEEEKKKLANESKTKK